MSERIAFIHSYLSDKERLDKNGQLIPDRATRACMVAALQLLRAGEVDKIALSVVPELAGPIKNRLRAISPNLPEDDILSFGTTTTTQGEVREIQHLFDESRSDKIVSICIGAHQPRVVGNVERILSKDERERLEVKTFKEVLENSRRFIYNGVVSGSDFWPEILQFARQEKIASIIAQVPFVGPFIVYTLPELLPNKIGVQRWLVEKFSSKSKSSK